MTQDLIRNFLTVAKTRNISRTAEILFVSQSTVSHRLQLLEEELGHTLVFRGKGRRQATLTKWGESFLPIAEKWIELWRQTEAFRQEETECSLSISCVNSLMTYLLRPFFSAFAQKHPQIHLRLDTMSTVHIYQQVASGEADVGIVLENPDQKSVNIRPLLSEKMYCVCHKDMFPGRSRIRPEELDPAGEIRLNWNTALKLWRDFQFPGDHKPRLQVNAIVFFEDALLWEGHWAIVPQTVADHFIGQGIGRCVELENPPPDRVSYVISPLLPSAGTQELINLFNRELDEFVAKLSTR